MQHLAHIDVAKPCNDPLIKQGGLQRGGFFPESCRQKSGAEFIPERLHADAFQKLVPCHFIFVKKVHDAEAAVIGINNPHAIIEQEDHVVMGPGTGANGALLIIKFAQVVWPCVFVQYRKAPGHAEMHEKAVAIIKVNQNILGPAWRFTTRLPFSRAAKPLKGKAQAGPAKLHRGDGPSNKDGVSARITVSTSGSSG